MAACILKACLIAAQLTHGGLYSIEQHLPKTASAYDGVKRNVSQFYEEENTPFYVGGHVVFDSGTRIDLTYNSGVDTKKLDVNKSLYVGIKQYQRLDDDWSVVYGGGVKLGGGVEHTSCLDSYDREYYCGDLTSWSDFSQSEHKTPYNAMIRFKYKFSK